MESKYKELKLLKQSEKSTVYLVCSGERKYIRKLLTGRHPIYELLMNNPHPGLPRLLEVTVSENSTTILEKYIEGQPLGTVELSKRQFSTVVRELCSVLTFLHGKGIIHRDIKPSNIILTEEGHVYLIDFDIAIENCIIKGFFKSVQNWIQISATVPWNSFKWPFSPQNGICCGAARHFQSLCPPAAPATTKGHNKSHNSRPHL